MGLANRLCAPGTARTTAIKLAYDLAQLPQTCLRNDRRAVYEQEGRTLEDAMRLEYDLGSATLQSGESLEGATRFAAGAGRHGAKA